MINISKLKSRKIWNNIAIIDLKFSPFKQHSETEEDIINYVASGINHLSKEEARNIGQESSTSNVFFEISDCILGVDLSNIGSTTSLSYLENLSVLIRKYPLCLINCFLSAEHLKKIHLHRTLKDNGYILPVFPRIAPYDSIASKKRYGNKLEELLKGTINSISEELLNIDNDFDREILLNRFPGMVYQDKKVKYTPSIIWLGVDSDQLSEGLTYLFTNNISVFDPENLCDEFKIDKSIFGKYIENSMLFGKDENNKVIFRLTQKNVLFEFMCKLTSQFESEMLRRNVCVTHKACSYESGNYGLFHEFHHIGRIFDNKDTFSLKMLAYTIQCVKSIEFSKIVLIDNGNEDSLYDLLQNWYIDTDVKIIRLLNYYNNPVLYPFNCIYEDDKVLILIDIINSGEFTNKVIDFIGSHKATIKGLFSYVINSDIKIEFEKKNIKLFYYIEKRLSNIDDIIDFEHDKRYINNEEHAFLFFWQIASNLCNIDKKTHDHKIRISPYPKKNVEFSVFYSSDMSIAKKPSSLITDVSLLVFYIRKLIYDNHIDLIVIKTDNSKEIVLEQMFTEIDPKLKVVFYTSSNIENIINCSVDKKHILFFSFSSSVGKNILDYINLLNKRIHKEMNITALIICSMRNIVSETYRDSHNYLIDNLPRNTKLVKFYDSYLPYYLLRQDGGDQIIESKILNL